MERLRNIIEPSDNNRVCDGTRAISDFGDFHVHILLLSLRLTLVDIRRNSTTLIIYCGYGGY
jgi:hypothetical protein